jgi:hypothetical protein
MKLLDTSILFKEVSASSLGVLRLLFGFILLEDFVNFHDYFVYYLEPSKFYNTYDFFHWVHLLPNYLLSVFFYGAIGSCILFALGIHYRLNAIITFLSWTYIFLADKGHYNNHFYLVAIFLFFFCVVDADRWGTPVKKAKQTVPYWQVLLFRWQIAIVYLYGGIAKLHYDWLAGFPMQYWLVDVSATYSESVQPLMRSTEMAYLFSYGGLLFDLTIAFFLLSKKWRRWALIPVVAFHTLNDFMWSIGDFPTIMLASTAIFFAPNWAEKTYERYHKKQLLKVALGLGLILGIGYGLSISDLFKGTNLYIKMISYPILAYLFFRGNEYQKESDNKETAFSRKRISLAFLTIWFAFQLTLPLRHFLYKGDPSWTGEGHLFAWRMMLVDTVDAWRMKVVIPETGEELPIALDQYINYRQYRKMRRTPKSFLRFAHFIRDRVKENGVENPIIKMEIWKSVNNRTPQLINDTTLNYAIVPYSATSSVTWMTDWSHEDELPAYSKDQFKMWRNFLEKDGVNATDSWR